MPEDPSLKGAVSRPSLSLTRPGAVQADTVDNDECEMTTVASPEPALLPIPCSGLSNLGTTCFVNVLVQLLSRLPRLSNALDHLLSVHGEALRARYPVVHALAQLRHDLQRHARDYASQPDASAARSFLRSPTLSLTPSTLIAALTRASPLFSDADRRQHDVHELLRFFLAHASEAQLVFAPHTQLPILVPFSFHSRSRLRCDECEYTSDTLESSLDLSVPLSDSLVSAIQLQMKTEHIRGSEKYFCPDCQRLTEAQKTLTFSSLPDILTIQLKRFSYTTQFASKLLNPMEIPFLFDLEKNTNESTHYELFGVILHSGISLQNGHYTVLIHKKHSNILNSNFDQSVDYSEMSSFLSLPKTAQSSSKKEKEISYFTGKKRPKEETEFETEETEKRQKMENESENESETEENENLVSTVKTKSIFSFFTKKLSKTSKANVEKSTNESEKKEEPKMKRIGAFFQKKSEVAEKPPNREPKEEQMTESETGNQFVYFDDSHVRMCSEGLTRSVLVPHSQSHLTPYVLFYTKTDTQ